MTPKKENIEEYKALEASRQHESMEAMIKAHLQENCPKYDEAHFEGCMRYLVACAREILGNKNGEVSNDTCYRICRDYYDDEMWLTEKEPEKKTAPVAEKKQPKKAAPKAEREPKTQEPNKKGPVDFGAILAEAFG